ncbi:hypothetical protein [Candidatus Ichthyocystis sparus]|nr:hypothetical protein [Candidatus Ichthyocystis sparus]
MLIFSLPLQSSLYWLEKLNRLGRVLFCVRGLLVGESTSIFSSE